MKDKIVIFGAGEWGKTAWFYYHTQCEVICFVDNSEKLWGTFWEGIEICSPEKLKTLDLSKVKLVIASKRRSNDIQKQLYSNYGVTESIIFRVRDEVEEYISEADTEENRDEHIIMYGGGLGNQMFQYAFARCFQKQGCYVTGDFSDYYHIGRRKFILTEVFPNIKIPECNYLQKRKYKESVGDYIKDASIQSVDKKSADIEVLQRYRGYFEGFWQSFRYADFVKDELKKDFSFAKKPDARLENWKRQIKSENAVSVHVRRGDYLLRDSQISMGDICTISYYKRAIAKIKDCTEHPVFYFFSNDIEWVRENIGETNAVYISEDLFSSYEDWYDMLLMSLCRHNIIANSSFSWWGAWLNANQDKIVIAPSRWTNICDVMDICPPDWIRI